MKLTEPECLSCHLVEMTNSTETEISLFLRKHPMIRGGAKEGKVVLPKAVTPQGCLYNEAFFSKDLTHYVLDCRGPTMPRVLLFESKANRMIANLDSNAKLQTKVANMSLPNVRLFNVTLSSGYVATVRLFLPPEITIETFTSYPLVVEV